MLEFETTHTDVVPRYLIWFSMDAKLRVLDFEITLLFKCHRIFKKVVETLVFLC